MIPRSLDDFTPALLTQLLSPRFPGVEVGTVRVDGEIHGTATKARLLVDYMSREAGPDVMWLKAGWEASSEILSKVGIFAREPRVYQELLPTLPMVVAPQCYGARWDDVRLEGVLLMEDLGPAGAVLNTPRSNIAIEQVSAMLAMLGAMHGSTSSRRWNAQHQWLWPLFRDALEPDSYLRHVSAPASLASYLEMPRARDLPRQARNPEAVHRAFEATKARGLADRQRCMIHGDAHVGNSYVDASGKPGLLDWQCVWRGGWAFDVSYYLVSALSPEERRRHEKALLRDYLQRRETAGGPALGWDAAWASYTGYLAYGFVVWLANSVTFQPEEFNAIVATRFAHAMVDHGMI
ncbi:MAG: aminoglycoside phosphotransferase [Bradyrhizobium sp.]|nr:aminoglycoside phosphotransferase [Bradyrhizobium sp.]